MEEELERFLCVDRKLQHEYIEKMKQDKVTAV